MAAIDKLYATEAQYHDIRQWLYGHNPDLIQYLYRYEDWPGEKNSTQPISLFPQSFDAWLLDHCDVAWVTDQIREQYDRGPNESLLPDGGTSGKCGLDAGNPVDRRRVWLGQRAQLRL